MRKLEHGILTAPVFESLYLSFLAPYAGNPTVIITHVKTLDDKNDRVGKAGLETIKTTDLLVLESFLKKKIIKELFVHHLDL